MLAFSFGTLEKLVKTHLVYVYTYTVRRQEFSQQVQGLFALPCACQNLRRVTRIVTRIYDEELRKAGLEITQFGLLTALAKVGEGNQKLLSAGFGLDSTTLTRSLALLRQRGLVQVHRGRDKRERIATLTGLGKSQIELARPHWQRAELRLRKALGPAGWKKMQRTVSRLTAAAMTA